ncbi:MAG TPA: ATP-binding protein [Xanthomonadaceae bacterium]|nr:ATP-binding protein [Xanthomonadaceae bacterium]HEV2619587.1 ATP-binding protein [Acidobacteriaceae bacterium]
MASILENLSRGKRIRAPKITLYGGPKIGKSTFCAQIPGAIVIDIEGGLDALDVTSVSAKTYKDVLAILTALATEQHEHRAVVLDSLDWMESLLWQHVCALHNVTSIELVGGGYGKGYLEAAKLWGELFQALDYLRNERGMAIVLIAHDIVSKMQPPDGEPYNYAELKLHARAAALVKEWSDCIAYATEKTFTKKDDMGFNKKHVRAIGSNTRVLVVGKNPAYVSGNRYGMQDEVSLDWNAFVSAMNAAVDPTAQAA